MQGFHFIYHLKSLVYSVNMQKTTEHERKSWPESLDRLAAILGADKFLTQGPGGNVSIKEEGVLWVKASGASMKDALRESIFVGLDLEEVRSNIREGVEDFTIRFGGKNSKLRASIETAMHAQIEAPVVAHVHSVGSMSLSILKDHSKAIKIAKDVCSVISVPYVKPGIELANELKTRLQMDSRAALLGNHGLTVWGDSNEECIEAISKLEEVWRAELAITTDVDEDVHVVGTEKWIKTLTSGILVPDELVFLGVNPFQIRLKENTRSAMELLDEANKEKILLTPWLLDFIEVLEKVARSVVTISEVSFLTKKAQEVLTNWDAEKYRQTKND